MCETLSNHDPAPAPDPIMTLSLNCEFLSHRHNIAVQVLASYVHAEVGGEPAVGPLPVTSGRGVGREEAALVETIDHHYTCAKT